MEQMPGAEARKEVDRHGEEITKELDTYGRVYKKQGEVTAVQVQVETPVETVLADGTKETTNTALPGDFIVTNPGGEQYVLKPEKFQSRYEPKESADGA